MENLDKMERKIYGRRNKSYAKAVHFEDFTPENYIIIDIRNPVDYKTRHLPNALNITDYDELLALIANNKTAQILLQCYSGHTVAELGNHLVLQGFDNIFFLDEVIDDYWHSQ